MKTYSTTHVEHDCLECGQRMATGMLSPLEYEEILKALDIAGWTARHAKYQAKTLDDKVRMAHLEKAITEARRLLLHRLFDYQDAGGLLGLAGGSDPKIGNTSR